MQSDKNAPTSGYIVSLFIGSRAPYLEVILTLMRRLALLSLGGALLGGCAAISGLDGLSKVDDCTDCTETGADSATVDARVNDTLGDTARDTLATDGGTDGGVDSSSDSFASDTTGTDSTPPPIDSGTDTSPVDASDSGTVCPSGEGPTMVAVPAGYCIDSTEVTNAQYGRFLAAAVSPSTQPSYCSFNTTFTPSTGWPASPGEDPYPIVAVDWCDARAFCQWAGKRLCGHPGSGPTPYAAFGDSSQSEWFNACSAGGMRTYPYGSTYNASICEGGDIKPNKIVATAFKTGCVGGYPGIFDMSGNVLEWEDACDATAGGTDTCHMRGGSDLSGSTNLQCSAGTTDLRQNAFINVGFRCCAF